MFWDIFSISVWDKLTLLSPTLDGKPYEYDRELVWPFKQENLMWAADSIVPLFALFYTYRDIWPTLGRPSSDEQSFSWSMYTSVLNRRIVVFSV